VDCARTAILRKAAGNGLRTKPGLLPGASYEFAPDRATTLRDGLSRRALIRRSGRSGKWHAAKILANLDAPRCLITCEGVWSKEATRNSYSPNDSDDVLWPLDMCWVVIDRGLRATTRTACPATAVLLRGLRRLADRLAPLMRPRPRLPARPICSPGSRRAFSQHPESAPRPMAVVAVGGRRAGLGGSSRRPCCCLLIGADRRACCGPLARPFAAFR